MIRLGGKVYVTSEDPQDIARAHREFGYTAASCPIVSIDQTDRIRKIRKSFEAEDVVIAEVGAWCNMVDSDPARRRANQQFVKEKLAAAEEVGARCCVDYPGSVAPGGSIDPHPFNMSPEGFELCVETVRAIIDTVNPKRTKFLSGDDAVAFPG